MGLQIKVPAIHEQAAAVMQHSARAELERAAADRGQTRIGVGTRQCERARAGLGEVGFGHGSAASGIHFADDAGVGGIVACGIVHGQGLTLDDMDIATARKRADSLAVSDAQRGATGQRDTPPHKARIRAGMAAPQIKFTGFNLGPARVIGRVCATAVVQRQRARAPLDEAAQA